MGWREAITKVLAGKTGGPWEGGIRAYHSSPHDFDKVDFSKLRTGEGANVYGAGHYMAENPAVSGQGGQYWDQFSRRFPENESLLAAHLRQHDFDRKAAQAANEARIEQLRKFYADEPATAEAAISRLQQQNTMLREQDIIGPRTYEMNLRAKPEELLDWDKPLSAQPQIVERLPQLIEGAQREAQDRALSATSRARADQLWSMVKDPTQATGEFAYNRLAPRDYNKASEMLREAGIPGIRYLDEGSRNINGRLAAIQPTGDGYYVRGQGQFKTFDEAKAALGIQPQTYNYVGTDPSKLDILAKYGVAGAAALPPTLGAFTRQDDYEAPR